MPDLQFGRKINKGENPPYTIFGSPSPQYPWLSDEDNSAIYDTGLGDPDETDLLSSTHAPNNSPIQMSMAVLILIVVASLSLVVGAIYLLIYFKSIKPMSARSRSYIDQGGKTDDEGGRSKSAHPFFRRKWRFSWTAVYRNETNTVYYSYTVKLQTVFVFFELLCEMTQYCRVYYRTLEHRERLSACAIALGCQLATQVWSLPI